MRINPLLAGLLATSFLVSACAAPQIDPYTGFSPAIEEDVSYKSHPAYRQLLASQGQDGRGFTLIRRYSDPAQPTSYGPTLVPGARSSWVLDVGIETRVVDGFPLYRMGLLPQNVPSSNVQSWSGQVVLRGHDGAGQPQFLSAFLKAGTAPDGYGFLWSEWTFCADCYDLDGLSSGSADQVSATLSRVEAAKKLALAPNGSPSPYDGTTLEFGTPGVRLLTGTDARAAARKAGVALIDARTRVALQAPSQVGAGYEAAVKAWAMSGSPSAKVISACGAYTPSSASEGTAAQTQKLEEERFLAWEACAESTLKSFDRSRRAAEIEAWSIEERDLATAYGVQMNARARILTMEGEMAAARKLGQAAHEAYQARVKSLESAARTTGEMKIETPDASGVVVGPREFKLGGDITEGLPEGVTLSQPKAAPTAAQQPPSREEMFVARLIQGGANFELGTDPKLCTDGLTCDTGKIVPMIGVQSYCAAPGGLTQTTPGWGLVVQRYMPKSLDEEKKIEAEAKASRAYAISKSDAAALSEGMAEVVARMRDGNGNRIVFTSYQDFYAVSGGEKGCTDDWRDAARHKVLNNG